MHNHSYVEIKELIHNPRLPILFRPPPPPPQVVTCSSASALGNKCAWLLQQYVQSLQAQLTSFSIKLIFLLGFQIFFFCYVYNK